MKRGQELFNFSLVFILIAVTGIPFFYASSDLILLFAITCLILYVFKRMPFDFEFILILLIFITVEIVQGFVFGNFSLRGPIGTSIRLLLAYLIVKMTGYQFIEKYIKIIYVIALISFVFYGLSFIPGFADYFVTYISPLFRNPLVEDKNRFYEISPNIIIYTFEKSLFLSSRNSGAFWEPGGFAIFLNLALLFNLVKTRKLFNLYNIAFIIGIATTLSTGGFIAMFLIIFLFYLSMSHIRGKVFYMVLILSSSIILLSERALNLLAISCAE